MAKKRTRTRPATNARQRVSADVSRRKAQLKRRHLIRKRAMIAFGAVLVANAAFGLWWLAAHDSVTKAATATSRYLWNSSARSGFAVRQVYLEGREHLPQAALKRALKIEQGAPILALSLEEMHARLMALPEVREVSIRRVLPDAIHVHIEERKPVALWQRAGAHAVIDRDGVVLNRPVSDMPRTALLVVGEDVPRHMAGLLAMLESTPALAANVESAVRVGERRWNIELRQGITVLLPQDGAAEAWNKFAGLVEKERILTRAVRQVDMRLEDRVFVTPRLQEGAPKILTSAQEM